MAMPKKYDYVQICADRGLKYLYEENPYIYFIDRFGFKHKSARVTFATSEHYGSIKTVVGSVEDYFIEKTNERHSGFKSENSFGEFVYLGAQKYCTITCVKHGDYKTKPNWLLSSGSTCQLCCNERTRERLTYDTQKFKKLAKDVHGDRYCYDLTEYVGCRDCVRITCTEHGTFEKIPYLHLQGSGCPECVTNGYGASDYEKVCPEGSSIYLMKFESSCEMFYKIGISKKPSYRSNDISKDSGYAVDVLFEMHHEDARKIWHLENDLHNIFHYFKYKPQVDFKGKTECFSFICKDEFKELCKAYLQ